MELLPLCLSLGLDFMAVELHASSVVGGGPQVWEAKGAGQVISVSDGLSGIFKINE